MTARTFLEGGYTGHEHLDTVGLINMNGRMQDPAIGRFISADPFVQAPFYTQSHNRYAYVWNNPTTLSDPSGFCTVTSPDDPCPPAGSEGCSYAPCDSAEAMRSHIAIMRLFNESVTVDDGYYYGEASASPQGGDLQVSLRQQRAMLAMCNAAVGSGAVARGGSCIDDSVIRGLQQTGPSTTDDPDVVNPHYLGKVTVAANGGVAISMSVLLLGDTQRAAAAQSNIVRAFGRAGVVISFSQALDRSNADLVIFGASLQDFIAAGVACTCTGAANIGGWGPYAERASPNMVNMLYVNAALTSIDALSDAHEFAHKLGLRHNERGLMTYPPGAVSRSDVERIRVLYGGP